MLSPLRFRPVWANDRQSDKGIPATTALRQEGHTHTRILAVCPLHPYFRVQVFELYQEGPQNTGILVVTSFHRQGPQSTTLSAATSLH